MFLPGIKLKFPGGPAYILVTALTKLYPILDGVIKLCYEYVSFSKLDLKLSLSRQKKIIYIYISQVFTETKADTKITTE